MRRTRLMNCIPQQNLLEQTRNIFRDCVTFSGSSVVLDDDGLPLDEVGPWAKQKLERRRRYVDISRATRRKFVQGTGGATYVDLFSGTGRAIIRDTAEKLDGSA